MRVVKKKNRSRGLSRLYGRWLGATLVLTPILFFVVCAGAFAFSIPTGNDDIEIRWDNTIKYNLGYRVEGQQDPILKSPNNDDGDRNFDIGVVSNRVDLLSEFDFRYKKRVGFRVSGAGWYDQRYHDKLDNNSAGTSNHLEGGLPAIGLSDTVKRNYAGPNGELLDAFVFGNFDLGPVSVGIKAGRHTIYWGESLTLLGAIHGVSYAQMPIDVQKGLAVPGTDAKELFRPLNNISATAQLTDNFSISGQYLLQWEPYRLPEAGSYGGFSDIILQGGESLIFGPWRFIHGEDVEPRGGQEWGASARWSPEWLDGTIGVYYRHFSDKLFQTYLDLSCGQYYFVYPDKIDLYGVSVSRQILGVSVGAELNYRVNMPLVSDTIVTLVRPGDGDTFGARGNTWHGVINGIYIFTPPLCDTATVLVEMAWSRVDKVTQGYQYFKGRNNYNAMDAVTNDFVGFSASFTPTWFQVFPGMDLSMPLSFNTGLSGNTPVTQGGNARSGNYSVGLAMDVYSKYRIDLKYIDYFGTYATDATGTIKEYNSTNALLNDRGMFALTVKFTL